MTTSFTELCLGEPLLRALAEKQHLTPTPIQVMAIPPLLEGRDLIGLAQTGTGKTAAFALPILRALSFRSNRGRGPYALVLAPTRELVIQIGDSFRGYGRHLNMRTVTVFGGVDKKPQVDTLACMHDILVATPGRLLDLCAENAVRFDRLSVLVLDEADRMLDMGFLPDIKRILALLPKRRQTMLFSATMPDSIARFAASLLHRPVRVEAAPPATTAERVDQHVVHVASPAKSAVLAALLNDPAVSRALVFARTKHGADRIAQRLIRAGIDALAIHGDKSQNARLRALKSFSSSKVRILVATDIAARGIDVDGISHVVNFDIPNEADSYVHRIGRTGRAGASGVAISLCDASERKFLVDIEKRTGVRLQVLEIQPGWAAAPTSAQDAPPKGRNAVARRGARPVSRDGLFVHGGSTSRSAANLGG